MDLKHVLIFGDSYSTFEGCIPEGYVTYYIKTGGESDITKESETWWHQMLVETGADLVLNDSWSGSTVCYTGYEGEDCSETSSFLCRLEKMINNGFFEENEINTVFVFGGTNDSWANAPIGKLQYDNWEKQDLYAVLPAVCCFLYRLKRVVPNARLVYIVNSGLKSEITDGIKAACAYYGIQAIQLENIDKHCDHPTVQGMIAIKQQILEQIQ